MAAERLNGTDTEFIIELPIVNGMNGSVSAFHNPKEKRRKIAHLISDVSADRLY